MLYTRTPGADGVVRRRRVRCPGAHLRASSTAGDGSFVLLHISTVLGERAAAARYSSRPGPAPVSSPGLSGVGLITIDDDGSHALHLDYELG